MIASEEKARHRRRRARGGGEGDVHQRSDGRWEARLDFGVQLDNDGRKHRVRKSFYGKTRRAVVDQMDQFRADLRSGLATVARQPLLSEWLDYWLEHLIKPDREPTTYELYEVLVRLHIKPHLGNVRLDRLHTATIEQWLADLERSGVGLRTRQSALLRLRTALTVAVQRRRLSANPVEHVEPPKGIKRARRPAPSLEDARRLLDGLAEDPLMKAFALALAG